MQDSPFFDEGTAPAKGIRRAVVLARRLLRRVLRPMLFRLDADLRYLAQRQAQLDEQLRSLAGRQAQGDEQLRSLAGRQAQGDEQLRSLAGRQDQGDKQLKSVMALGWDHIALVRRLAAIEDHLAEAGYGSAPGDRRPLHEGEDRPSIPYPGHDEHRAEGPHHLHVPQSKVS